MDLKKYQRVLCRNIIFENMTEKEVEKGLQFFSAKVSKYQRGEILNMVSDPMDCFAIVLEGVVHVCMTDYEGQKTIMATVCRGDGFGEALSFLGCDSAVYIRAAEDSVVLWLSSENVKNAASQTVENNIYVQRFVKDLAVRTLKMNDRIQILSKRTLREKLLTFFSLQVEGKSFGNYSNSNNENKFGNVDGFQNHSDENLQNSCKSFSLPLDRCGMAVYLGVDRSSLSRELSKMKDEGLIEFKKNKFKILY